MQARRVLGIITLALLLHVLQGCEVFFAGTNLYYFVNVVYEDLAIADMSGVQSLLGSIDAAKKALYTGHIGDGKIFVYNVDKVVKVRTGEEDFAALQDVE